MDNGQTKLKKYNTLAVKVDLIGAGLIELNNKLTNSKLINSLSITSMRGNYYKDCTYPVFEFNNELDANKIVRISRLNSKAYEKLESLPVVKLNHSRWIITEDSIENTVPEWIETIAGVHEELNDIDGTRLLKNIPIVTIKHDSDQGKLADLMIILRNLQLPIIATPRHLLIYNSNTKDQRVI